MAAAKFASATDKLLVASIDFGTTYSGYAFSFRHEYERDPLKVNANTWIEDGQTGLASWKTPTTLLLNPDQTFHSFGYKAEETYMEKAEDDEHHDYYYFRRFKMLLHDKLRLKRDVEIEDATGKSLPALTVFSASIRYLSEHLLGTIRNRGIQFNNDDILWVLTVPAIWNEPAKQFMREAAEQAGINGSQLKLALEPEAASLYCMTVPLVKLEVDEKGKTKLGPFLPSTKYMVLDLGGGTVDVTVHEVMPGSRLRELHKANGGAWGGTKVDASYYALYSDIFGAQIMDDFKTESKIEFLELEREFEQKKRNIKPDSRVTIRISAALKDFIRERTGQTAEERIKASKHAEDIKLRGDRMMVQAAIIENLFVNSITSIVKHVTEILNEKSCQNLDKILLVGGFSESPLVRHAIKNAFSDRIDVVCPDEPGLAVLKGAVIFGHSPNVISSRVARYTYGVAVQGTFMKGFHQEKDKVVEQGSEIEYCRNLFSKFVEIDDEVEEGHTVSKEYAIGDSQADVVIEVFMSKEHHPISTTEDYSEKLGQIFIKVPIGGWRGAACLRVEFDFGGTEFSVKAIETITQLQQDVKFDFLS